jgi:hypothetical protein
MKLLRNIGDAATGAILTGSADVHPHIPRPIRLGIIAARILSEPRSAGDKTATFTGGVSTLIKEHFRVLSTPFLATFSVLSNNNFKTHTGAPIAFVASHAQPKHSLPNFVPRYRPLSAGCDLNTSRTDTNGLSKQLATQS